MPCLYIWLNRLIGDRPGPGSHQHQGDSISYNAHRRLHAMSGSPAMLLSRRPKTATPGGFKSDASQQAQLRSLLKDYIVHSLMWLKISKSSRKSIPMIDRV